MLYTIYRQDIDIDHFASEDVKQVLQECDELIEAGTADAYQVYMWSGLDFADYCRIMNDNNAVFDDPDDVYSLETFCRCFGLDQDEIPSPEIYHNLTRAEQIEALHFIPDEMIINELSRRFNEYRRTTDAMADIFDKMKIYI